MSKLPKVVPDAHGMRMIGDIIQELLPAEFGFTLLVFPFGDEKHMANYISNARREDMLAFLQETLDRLKGQNDIKTPSMN